MPRLARGLIVLPFLALASPAAAQLRYDPLVVGFNSSPHAQTGRATLPDFRMPRGDLREAGAPPRNGLIAAMPLSERVTIGVGRFSVLEQPRVRTHTESTNRAAEVRRRERGIAAVGVNFSF